MTTTQTAAKQWPAAMYAVAGHMLEHRLPGPDSIEAPRLYEGGRHVVVYLTPHEAAEKWAATIHVDDEQVEAGVTDHFERVTWSGRLPDTGVRVQIRALRRTDVGRLYAVPSTPDGAA